MQSNTAKAKWMTQGLRETQRSHGSGYVEYGTCRVEMAGTIKLSARMCALSRLSCHGQRLLASVLALGIVVIWCSNPSITIAQEQSVVFRELIEAEALLYEGDYDEAMRRIAIASKSIAKEGRSNNLQFSGTDPQLLKGIIDIFKGQIYLEQGFLSDADLLIKRGQKQIEDRQTYWLQRFGTQGRGDVNDARVLLLEYAIRSNLANILRGEVAMEQAWVAAAQAGGKPSIGTARELLNKGIAGIRNNLEGMAARNLYERHDYRRTWYHARLREIEAIMDDDDIRRARELMNELDRDVTAVDDGDLFWHLTFNPRSRTTQKGGEKAGGEPPAGGTPEADEEGKKGPSLSADVDAAGKRDSSRHNRMKARMARFYADMLEVDAELTRREADFLKKPGFYLKAEEEAARGRDVAEEHCWGTPLCASALINVAHSFLDMHRVYSEGDRLEKIFDFQGDKINIHDRRLASYLDDVDDIIQRAGEQLDALSLATTHPVLLRYLLLQERFGTIAPGRVDLADVAQRKEDFFKGPPVRAFLARDPEAPTAEIVEDFKQKKFDVRPEFVERIKTQVKEPSAEGGPRRSDKPWPTATKGKFFVAPLRSSGERPSLLEQEVVQVLGDVAATDSYEVSSDKESPPDHYWRLTEAAIGKVTKLDPDRNTAEVEFATAVGWSEVKLDKDRSRYWYVNPYSGEVSVLEVRNDRKLYLIPERNGLLLTAEQGRQGKNNGQGGASPAPDGGGDGVAESGPGGVGGGADKSASRLALPIRVQFPLDCINLRPPKKGEVVTRGPDWNKGVADGGRSGMTGRLEPWPGDGRLRNDAGYVRVKWDVTERLTLCRWHVRGLYDVWPISEERALEGQVKANPVEATPQPPESGKESEKE